MKNIKKWFKTTPKIAVIIHLYWVEMWSEFENYLTNIDYKYDLYVSLVEDNVDIYEKIKKFKEDANIIIVDNKGADIGPAYVIMKNILNNKKSYKYYLKLHTKEDEIWRSTLINPICGSKKAVNNCIEILKCEDVGMIGSNKCMLSCKNPIYLLKNSKIIQDYIDRFGFKDVTPSDCVFIGGTMFWVSGDVWESFFKSINIDKEYDKFCTGKFNDIKIPRYTHSMERLFGLIIKNAKLKLIGIE